ncbi:MAG: bifunctional anthranilate synthase component II/anthranilate phosphoribosyltransferase [Ruminococcus sp.]|uniref:bifunctional anthranilate synthase component II/anthranilate phosphoribosyltransferase n=1 Tax=Ruminococcus sp. TaxID=41978 RepID=UPI0025EBCD1E|nr:bifunctional anthranilate synthase component II/anthranilate phosphoribosyltransferase [Ruminococcus sp.]MCR5542124.1 bifunctional anthranilate synthase component II/anthranilate phosphoribosyltransferase [Ruminococcus sp.]
MILLIDNYDSFTYNLYQAIGVLNPDIKVVRNDEITIEEIEKLDPQALVVSPGPCYPKDAGISVEAIRHFSGKLPIFGVCLGHQSIAEAFGGHIIHAAEQMHGKQTSIDIDNDQPIFKGLKNKVDAARYHSLIVEKETLPDCLEVIGTDDRGQIMALKHREHPTYGVQFHPESILTEYGSAIIANFLRIAGIEVTGPQVNVLPDSERTELKSYISKVVDGQHLTREEARDAIDIIMGDRATNAQTAALLTAMRMNVETIDEITGCAQGMRDKMAKVPHNSEVLEIVGTGGDLAQSFNISTTSSFVVSACGQAVAKHGNRSVSSRSGAADVLEALGVKIASTPEKAAACIDEVGVCFLFAQSYHKAMRFVGPVRAQSGIRTVFNILGPLANPANAEYNVIGVYEERLIDIVANVLKNLGVKHSLVVYGSDGLDEISISAPTYFAEIDNGQITRFTLSPEDVGLTTAKKSDIVGGDALENASITLGILKGEIQGAKRDIVLFNSGAALYACGKANNIEAGVRMAREAIDSGAALAQLNKLIEFTNRG